MQDGQLEILLGAAAIYVTMIGILTTVAPAQEEHASRLVPLMRYARYVVVAILVKIITELITEFGPLLVTIDSAGTFVVRLVPAVPLREGTELYLGLVLVGAVWTLRSPLFDLEQVARRYKGREDH